MKVSKIIIIVFIVIVMTGGTTMAAGTVFSAQLSDIKLYVNNKKIDQDVVVINGSSYLPVRAISEALGLTVDWNGKEKTIYLSQTKEASSNETVKYAGDGIVPFNYQSGHEYNGVQIVCKTEGKWKNSPMDYSSSITDNLNNEYTNYIFMHIFKRFSAGEIMEYVDTKDRWLYVDFPLQKKYKTFKSTIGLTSGSASTIYTIKFTAYGDGNKIYEKILKAGDFPEDMNIDISGVNKLTFRMESTGSEISYEAIGLFNPQFIN